MFTKLKNKIAEEVKQSPLKLSASVQQLAQAVVSPSSNSVVEPATNDHFSIGDDSEETPQNSPSKSEEFQSVDLHGEVAASSPVPPGGRSRRSSTCSVSSETSLFPIFESSVMNSFNPQSDLESASEVEDSVGHQLGAISKEQLYSAYRKIQLRYAKYKSRYATLAKHYKELDRDNIKAKTVLVESQDKALRRIAELKEQCQLEQKAKAHLEEALRNDLEEKDHLISTLHTKLELLKLNGGREDGDSTSQKENNPENLLIDFSTDQNTTVSTNLPEVESISPEVNADKEKLKKLEILLAKCKESIKRNKDKISQLTSENQQLQETLKETEASNNAQLSKLMEDLKLSQQEVGRLEDNLNTLRKREEDAALSLAENKLTIHRELEAKEEQIKSLRDSLTQLTKDRETLIERATTLQNEITELKSAASVTSSTEDVVTSEEDRQNLIQELSRGKAEAVRLLQQEMQKKFIDFEKNMSDQLQSTENKNVELLAEIEELKKCIEEKDQAKKELEDKLNSITKEDNLSEKLPHSSEQDSVVKDLEKQLHVAKEKLLDKEHLIADMEISVKNLVENRNTELHNLESKVKAETDEKLQIEKKLEQKEIEIKKLNKKYADKMEEQLKILGDTQSQLDLELLKKSETEKKNKDLLNQIENMESILKSKESEINSLSSEIMGLKELAQNLNSKLKETSEDCIKAKKEKENVSLAFVFILNSVKQLKSSLQFLRKDVFITLDNVKDDVCRVGSQVSVILNETQNELIKSKDELVVKDSLEIKLRANIVELEKELSDQKFNSKVSGELEGMLEDLRVSKKNLESELSENNALVKKLQHELENTTKTSGTKDQELIQLHNSITDLEHELAQLTNLKNEYIAKLETKEAECNDLQNKLHKSDAEVHNIKRLIKNSEKKLKEISISYDVVQQENEKPSHQVNEMEAESEALELEKMAVHEERTRLDAVVNEINNLLEKHKQENQALHKKLNEALDSNKEITDLKCKVESLTKDLVSSNEEKHTLSITLNTVTEKILALNNVIKSMENAWNDKIKLFDKKITDQQVSLHSAQEKHFLEKQNFEDQLSALTLQLKESQNREQELLAVVEKIREETIKESSKNRDEISDYEKNVSKLQNQIAESYKMVQELKNENVNQKQLLEKRESELENIKAERGNILAKMQDFETKFLRLNEEKVKWSNEISNFDTKEKNLEESNSKLKDKLTIEMQERKLLEEQNKRFKEDSEERKKQLDKLSLEIETLKEALLVSNTTIENLQLERKSLEQSVSSESNQREEHSNRIEILEREVANLKSENNVLNISLNDKSKELEKFEKELTSKHSNLEELKINSEKIQEEKNILEERLNDAMQKKNSLEEQLIKSKKEIKSFAKENTELEQKLKTAIESSVEMKSEKNQLEEQLDNTLLDLQAKEKQVAELEEVHTQKIKQLVRDFEKQLVEKNEELTNMEDSKFERQEQEENLQIREYRKQVQELQEESKTQAEAFRQLYQKYEDSVQEKQTESKNYEQKTKELQAVHQQELNIADERWRQCLEQQLAEAEVRHKEELMELSKEWHWERKNNTLDMETTQTKELESTSQLAVAAVESGTGSIELLHRQLVAQSNELKEAKRQHILEVAELRRLLSLRRQSNSSDRLHAGSSLEDACTELEYLRNILFEYMMGKEPIVLARVIAAVVKFNTDQTAKVLQKEEQRQSLLGQLGIL